MKSLVMLAVLFAIAAHARAQDSCPINWDPPILLSDTAYSAISPRIAISGNDTVHITWEYGSGTTRLPYVRSMNGGLTFESRRELLMDSIQFPGQASWNHIVAYKDRVYVFFIGSTASHTPIRMLFSTNGGDHWSEVVDISPDTCGIIQDARVLGDTLAIVYPPPPFTRKILRSTNRGLTWNRTNESLNTFARVALSSGVLHLVQHGGPTQFIEVEYKQSTNLGDTWRSQEIISQVDSFYSDLPIIGSDGDSIVVTAWREAKYGCLTLVGCAIDGRWSTNAGATFGTEMRFDTQPSGIEETVAAKGSTLAVAWTDDLDGYIKLRLSSDHGTTWCGPINASHVSGGVPQLALSPTSVHLVWSSGNGNPGNQIRVWYRRGVLKTTSVQDESQTIPQAVSLTQNYPNPFNPSTIISYSVQASGLVRLQVYDLLGREVATLVDEKLSAGKHSVQWNGKGLPSGVYYYRLTTEGRIETKKAVLIK